MMHKNLFTLTFCLYVCVTSLANKNDVIITGTCSDTTVHEVRLIEFPPFFWRDDGAITLAHSVRTEANIFRLQVSISGPKKIYLRIDGNRWPIMLTPGDSVSFVISGNKAVRSILFAGKNSSHYNFYNQLEELVDPNRDDPQFKGDVNDYTLKVNEWHEKKKQFLDHYVSSNQTTEYFKWYQASEMDFDKCVQLYHPIKTGSLKMSELTKDYLRFAETLPWNEERLLDIDRFIPALVIRNIYCYTENPWANFDPVVKNVKQNFTGRVQEFLFASMIDVYAKNQSDEYSKQLLASIKDAEQDLSDSTLISLVKNSRETYLMIGKPIPQNTLQNSFLKDFSSDSIISLSKLLKKNKGKALYLDFWASWCSPCRVDMEEATEAKEYLKTRDVTVIYVSIDKASDEAKWKKVSALEGVTKNQYLLKSGTSSELATYFSIQAIPRYILINQEHLVYSTDAPRINQTQLGKVKQIISTMQQKIVTYK